MTHTEDELRGWLGRAFEMPYGSAQIALVEQVVRHADAGRFADLAFAARMLATGAYLHGGEPAKSLLTFSWCLACYDRDPGRRTAREHHLLLWHFKNVVGALCAFAEVPLERTCAVLDDMERRYRIGGHSMHAVYAYRHSVAAHLGDTAAADEWYARWCAAPRDELSDCAGCDPTSRVEHLAARGRDEEAVALAEPVLTGRAQPEQASGGGEHVPSSSVRAQPELGFGGGEHVPSSSVRAQPESGFGGGGHAPGFPVQLDCVEQPQGIGTALLLPCLRTGRAEQAADLHRRAYLRLRPHLRNLARVAEHVEFCALTGNEPRGLELVQRHLGWLDRAPSPFAAMEFTSAAALVLRRLTAAGHGGLVVHRPADGQRPATLVDVATLGVELAGFATALAGRFDARNGTKHHSGRIARRMAAEPLVEYLPLSATPRRRCPPGSSRPAGPKADRGRLEVPAGAGAAELLDLAERLARTDRLAQAREVWRVFDERYAADDLSARDAARRADGRGQDLAEGRNPAGAEAAWRAAIELYRQAGDELAEHAAHGRLGLLMCLTGRAAEGLPIVERSTGHLVDHGNAAQRAGAESRLGTALLAIGRPTQALAALNRAARHAVEAGDPHLAADVALRRAHCLSTLDRRVEQREAAAEARERYRELSGDGFAAACLLYGDSFRRPAESAAALAAFDEAVHAAEYGAPGGDATGGGDRVLAETRLARARAMCRAGRPVDAIEDFVEVVAWQTGQDGAPAAAATRLELAAAYRQAGRLVEAAEAAEEAVTGLAAAGAQEAADRCRYLLATVYRELGADDAALDLLDLLAANLDGFDNLSARGRMHQEAGEIHYRGDRDAVAAQRFAAAADAFARAGSALDELRARRRAMLALHWAGERGAALAGLSEIDARLARLPAELAGRPATIWEQAMTGYDATKILIGADRLDEALPRIRAAPAAFRSVQAFGEALLAELLLGELLLRLDRPADAEPVLRAVLAGLPRGTQPVSQAAWLLAEALGMLDRDDEAAELRTRFGLHPE